MNYQELAKELKRPLSTVRKWRADITRVSGVDFAYIKVKNGQGRRNRTTYDFSREDVEKFKQFMDVLEEGRNKEQAITQVFGSETSRKKKSDEEKIVLLTKVLKIQSTTIDELKQNQKEMQRQLTALTNRLEGLENKGIKNIFKK
ncbi:hypothetical protein GIX45_17510 [Erwinia sp. CPCC 100877]|nr:hypothetical protein [Erwinia sp. CPCC 100877]